MGPQQSFKLTRQAFLLAVIAAAYPVAGYGAVAGRVDFSIGQVMAVAADGSQRPLQKGSEVSPGDAINTAAGSRAQIRFTDGGYVSLQPNTQFRVDEYQYEGKTDGKEKGFFSLLRGGLRTITGAVGKANRDNYKVATPAATIGIRGTGYNAQLAEGLTISVTDGIISLTNKGGSLIITQGQSAYVADMNTAPSLTFEKPSTPPASLTSGTETPPPKADEYVAGDNTGGGGVNPGLTIVSGVASAFSGVVSGSQDSGLDYPGIVVFNEAGSKVYYIQDTGGITDFSASTLDFGTYGGFPAAGFDGDVAWGRFYGPLTYTEGGVTESVTLSANQGVHAVVGIPSASMPTVGLATFDLTGATRPTVDNGAWAPGTVTSGSMVVDFNSVDPLIGSGQLKFTMNSSNFTLNFSGSASGNKFTGLSTSVSDTQFYCSGSCSASVSGFFAGANAAKAGISYGISGAMLPSPIRGAAVYTQTSYSPSGGW